MPLDKTVQCTPVETGNMSEIPPDAPEGAWVARATVKNESNKKSGFPQLVITWKLAEALTDGNEDFVGSKVREWHIFYPARHEHSRMGKIKFKALCEAAGLDIPTISSPFDWADLADFVTELEATDVKLWTYLQTDKQTGEKRTQISFNPPGGAAAAARKSLADEDEEEEKPAAAKKLGPNGKPLKKKTAA